MPVEMSIREQIRGAISINDVLRRLKIASAHKKVEQDQPKYAHTSVKAFLELLSKAKKKRRRTITSLTDDLNNLWSGRDMLTEEQAWREELETVIIQLEEALADAAVPSVLFEHAGREITLRGALESAELWQIAITKIHDFAKAHRTFAEKLLRCFEIATVIGQRIDWTK